MSCRQCQGIETEFNEKRAIRQLKRYRKKGPAKTTRMLMEAIRKEKIKDYTLLDIGGGVGAIQYELLRDGAAKAISVDASTAYLEVAKEEAERQGLSDHIQFHHGDFVELANELPNADVITLDRVICCYDDMENLVVLSAGLARKVYGVVYPRDVFWVKMGISVMNFFFKVFKRQFRTFVHPAARVDAIIRSQKLDPYLYQKAGIWQVVVYRSLETGNVIE